MKGLFCLVFLLPSYFLTPYPTEIVTSDLRFERYRFKGRKIAKEELEKLSLQELISLALRQFKSFTLSTNCAPGEITHGILANGSEFSLASPKGEILALDFLLDQRHFTGQSSTFPLNRPLIYIQNGKLLLTKTKRLWQLLEDHPDQFLFILSQANVPLERTIILADGKTRTVNDLLNSSLKSCNPYADLTFTIPAYIHYLGGDARFTDMFGKSRTIEDLLQQAIKFRIGDSYCCGTHILYALAYAQKHCSDKRNVSLWKEIDEKLQTALRLAQQYQREDDSVWGFTLFTTKEFLSETTPFMDNGGHVFEWLAYYAPLEELEKAWVKRFARVLAESFILVCQRDYGHYSHLCHAYRGLNTYHQRVFSSAPPQAKSAKTTVVTSEPPRIKFDTVSHSFGEINEADGITSHPFKFTNVGKGLLVIKKTTASCGCTATLVSKSQLKAGDSGAITVSFNPRERHGEQEHSVFIETNDPQNQRLTLSLSGFVQSDLIISPPRLYLGELSPHTQVNKTLHCSSDPKRLYHITELQSPLKEFDYSIEAFRPNQPVREESIQRREVKLSFLAPEKPGNFESKITVHTNSPRKPQIVIPVEGSVVGELTSRPAKVFFGTLKPGQTADHTLKIYSRQKRPFTVKSAQPLDFPVHIESLPPKSATEHELTLLFTAPTDSSERVFKGHLEVRTDLEDQTLLVPLLAIVRSSK